MSTFNELKVDNETTILFNEQEIMVSDLNSTKHICNDVCSKPHISPDKSKVAFVSPYQWECVGKLYIYDLKNKEMKILETNRLPNQNTIKKIEWLDSNSILMIVGLAYGTVSVGGNLYLYNYSKNELNVIVQKIGKEQIKDFSICGNELNLVVAKFDDNFMSYDLKSENIVI